MGKWYAQLCVCDRWHAQLCGTCKIVCGMHSWRDVWEVPQVLKCVQSVITVMRGMEEKLLVKCLTRF